MTVPRAPLPLARAAVGLAVRSLPSLDDRLRYRAEFAADLSALAPLQQVRYAAGVLAQTFALRAALGAAPTRAEEAAMTAPARPRVPFFRCRVFRSHRGVVLRLPFWRCRVLRWHKFVVRSTSDGGRFQVCARCGLDRGPVGFGPMTTPPWPVGSAGR